MANPKKIIYWLISLISVIAVYGLYTFALKAPAIKPPSVQDSSDELPLTDFPKDAAMVADVGISNVAKTEFITRDEVTYKVKRILGFAKLLNPKQKNERWKLEKPYMKLFDDNFYCQVNSEKGNVKVETVMGQPNPKQGTLSENVVIKFQSQKNGKTTESFVYLDTLDYDSDRSELATDGPVKFVSENITMEGRGMLLLYNSALGRVEYFEIRDMDYLHVYNNKGLLGSPSEESVTSKKIATSESVGNPPASPAEKELVSAPAPKTPTADTVPGRVAPDEKKDYYQCIFRKNVMINHSGRLVATGSDNINIFNILRAKAGKQQNTATPDPAPENKPSVTPGNIKPAVNAAAAGYPVGTAAPPEPAAEVATDSKEPQIVVTCQNGFVVTPMEQTADEAFRSNSPSVLDLQKKPGDAKTGRRFRLSTVAEELSPADKTQKPARFRSQIIDYYMDANTMVGYGSVEFIYHPAPDPNAVDSVPESPIVITADDRVRYVADASTVNFSGNVVCSRTDITSEYVQDSNCIGDNLHITLYKKDSSRKNELSIKHVTVSGENPEMNSRRLVGDKVVNRVLLAGSQIDYDAIEDKVTAGAGGEIQINNSNAPPSTAKEKKKSLDLSGPCYAFIGDFDRLQWSLKNNTIYAVGEKGKGVGIGYMPVVDGQLGQAVYATAKKIEGIFTSTDTKRTELVVLTASDGVQYSEDGGHQFYGDMLFYNAAETLMTVTGLPGKPCFVDGAQTDRIDYDLATGKLETTISSSPSTISPPKKPKR